MEWRKPGGAGAIQAAKSLSPARAALLPELIVNLMGYQHLQNKDTKGAVAILKLNVLAYPNSANSYDSVSDAYLADGQKDLALQNARKALELVASDTTDPEQRRNDIRKSADQKINNWHRIIRNHIDTAVFTKISQHLVPKLDQHVICDSLYSIEL